MNFNSIKKISKRWKTLKIYFRIVLHWIELYKQRKYLCRLVKDKLIILSDEMPMIYLHIFQYCQSISCVNHPQFYNIKQECIVNTNRSIWRIFGYTNYKQILSLLTVKSCHRDILSGYSYMMLYHTKSFTSPFSHLEGLEASKIVKREFKK